MLEDMSKKELIEEIKRLKQFTICGCDGRCEYKLMHKLQKRIFKILEEEVIKEGENNG